MTGWTDAKLEVYTDKKTNNFMPKTWIECSQLNKTKLFASY